MTNAVILGTQKSANASPGYVFFWPGFQSTSSTSVTDRSGQGNNGALNSLAAATAFAAATGFAVTVSNNEQVSILNSVLTSYWKWNATDGKRALFLSFGAAVTLPASSKPLIGTGTNQTNGGMKLLITSGGAMQWAFYDQGTATVSGTSKTVDAAWSSSVWHTLGLYLNPVANAAQIYIDGIAQLTSLDSLSTLTRLDATQLTRLVFGGSDLGTSGVAASFRGVHLLSSRSSGALGTDNPDELAMRLHRSPATPVTADEWDS